MKVYFWDFHGVLEEGSEATLVVAINELRRRHGMFPDTTIEEVASYFGPSLPNILGRFFPSQDTKILAREIGNLAVGYTAQMMRPREGAVRTLRTIREKKGLNYVVSSADREDVLRQTHVLGLAPYLDGVSTFLVNGYSTVDNVEEFKAGIIFNIGLLAIQRNYHVTPERVVVIGDTETDMEAVRLAKEMINTDSRFRNVPITGALFDPHLNNSHTQADYRLRRLEDVLYI